MCLSSAGYAFTFGLGLSSWLRRTVRSLVDRVSSALLFCLLRNKKAMLRGGPARRGSSPERGEGGELWTPGRCYLLGENIGLVKFIVYKKGCGC